jgi:hypothetical protein
MKYKCLSHADDEDRLWLYYADVVLAAEYSSDRCVI